MHWAHCHIARPAVQDLSMEFEGSLLTFACADHGGRGCHAVRSAFIEAHAETDQRQGRAPEPGHAWGLAKRAAHGLVKPAAPHFCQSAPPWWGPSCT